MNKYGIWIVVGVIGALVAGVLGGIIGALIFTPKQEDTTALAKDLGAVQSRVQALETKMGSLPQSQGGTLKIGYVDAEALFTKVFLPQVASERKAMEAIVQEIQALQTSYAQGTVTQEAYQQSYAELQAKYLQAQAQVNMSMLKKMIASPGFANLRADLQNLQVQADPLVKQVGTLVEQASKGAILDYTTFLSALQQLQTLFQQVDQLLTQVAATKILEISQQVGLENDFDLVLRSKDVVMYRKASTITDLTPKVEERLWALFPAS